MTGDNGQIIPLEENIQIPVMYFYVFRTHFLHIHVFYDFFTSI